jgi:hypothetical protein
MTQIPLNTIPQDFIEKGTERVSLSALKFFQLLLRRVNLRDAANSAAIYTPISGDSITVNITNTFIFLQPNGVLGSLTVIFPAEALDTTEVAIKTTESITSLTLSATNILDPITTLATNGYVKYTYILSEQLWVKTSS